MLTSGKSTPRSGRPSSTKLVAIKDGLLGVLPLLLPLLAAADAAAPDICAGRDGRHAGPVQLRRDRRAEGRFSVYLAQLETNLTSEPLSVETDKGPCNTGLIGIQGLGLLVRCVGAGRVQTFLAAIGPCVTPRAPSSFGGSEAAFSVNVRRTECFSGRTFAVTPGTWAMDRLVLNSALLNMCTAAFFAR